MTDVDMVFVSDATHTEVRRANPAYRALTDEALLLQSVLTDLEDARDLDHARRIIEARMEDLWRRSRQELANHPLVRRHPHQPPREIRIDDTIPGWNGAGSNVDGVDLEIDRG